jgi:hypothetical protein
MAIKVTVLAKDIKVATELVEFAISGGCALIEYSRVESPLAKVKVKRTKKPDKSGRYGAVMSVVKGIKFRKPDSLRAKGYKVLNRQKVPSTAAGMIETLVRNDWTTNQARTCVSGLKKVGALAP